MTKIYDMEKLLRRFAVRPVPPEIGERVLRNTRLKAAERRILTSGLRLLLFFSLALGALSVLLDWPLDSRRQRTLREELRWSPEGRESQEQDAEEGFAEMMSEFPGLEALPRSLRKWALCPGEEGSSPRISLEDIKERIHEN